MAQQWHMGEVHKQEVHMQEVHMQEVWLRYGTWRGVRLYIWDHGGLVVLERQCGVV